jgi:hypothetical protein
MLRILILSVLRLLAFSKFKDRDTRDS